VEIATETAPGKEWEVAFPATTLHWNNFSIHPTLQDFRLALFIGQSFRYQKNFLSSLWQERKAE
jgi:hypothetical protein